MGGGGNGSAYSLRYFRIRMGFFKKIPSLILKFLSVTIVCPWGYLLPPSLWSLYLGWRWECCAPRIFPKLFEGPNPFFSQW